MPGSESAPALKPLLTALHTIHPRLETGAFQHAYLLLAATTLLLHTETVGDSFHDYSTPIATACQTRAAI